jgi:membrane protein required for colicin V production
LPRADAGATVNSFDVIISAALIAAMYLGFRAGLVRSAVSILGYVVAMPIAVWLHGLLTPQVAAAPANVQNSLLFFAIFLIAGILMGAMFRMAVNDMIGAHVGIADRLGGAVLGAVRVGLIAVTLVLIFDQLVPPGLQPSYLTGSLLRPHLSRIGQTGIRSLPPETTAMIDQWKRARRL